MMRASMKLAWLAALGTVMAVAAGAVAGQPPQPQSLTGNDRTMLRAMLRSGYEAVRDHYFDRTFNGLDWDTRYSQFQGRLSAEQTIQGGLLVVADLVDGLGDSHTHFFPPSSQHRIDYGYDLIAIGQRLHVSAVRPSTDAATKLRPGDLVIRLNEEPITRTSLPRIRYVLGALTPVHETRLTLQDPDGKERSVDVRTTVADGSPMLRMLGTAFRFSDLVRADQEAEFAFRGRSAAAGTVLVWKIPQFTSDLGDINRIVSGSGPGSSRQPGRLCRGAAAPCLGAVLEGGDARHVDRPARHERHQGHPS
jgi:hypothetical protein